MNRVCSVTVAGLVAIVGACHPAYKVPSLTEPHATMKLRIVYHATPRTELEQVVLLNGDVPPVPSPMTLPGEISSAIPIRLEGTRLDVRSVFFHPVTTIQTRSESYECGQIAVPCGTSTCYQAQFCTRIVSVPVTTRRYDAICEQAVGLGPQQDAVYLVQYDFFGAGRCTLACQRAWPQPDGTFRNTPCEPAPPKP